MLQEGDGWIDGWMDMSLINFRGIHQINNEQQKALCFRGKAVFAELGEGRERKKFRKEKIIEKEVEKR